MLLLLSLNLLLSLILSGGKLSLLDECDSLSTLEGERIQGLARHEHLGEAGDLNDHAGHFGGE